jgi:hypothetical protein
VKQIIGIVTNGTPETITSMLGPMRQALSENGYVDGQNVAIEYSLTASVSDQCANFVSRPNSDMILFWYLLSALL